MRSQDEGDEKFRVLERKRDHAQACGDKREEAYACFSLGLFYRAREDYENALKFFNSALSLDRIVGNQLGEAATLNNIGEVYYSSDDSNTALEYFKIARDIRCEVSCRTHGVERDLHGECTTLHNIGASKLALGQPELALKNFALAHSICEEVEDSDLEGRVLHGVGLAHYHLGDYDAALEYFSMALPLKRENGDRVGEAGTLNRIGAVELALDHPERALGSLRLALRICASVPTNSPESQAQIMSIEGSVRNSIGVIYGGLGNHDTALEYLNKSLSLAQDRSHEAAALHNIGAIYIDAEKPDIALEYFNSVLMIDREVGDLRNEANTLNNLAIANQALGNQKAVLSSFRESIRIRERLRSEIADDDFRMSLFSTLAEGYGWFSNFLITESWNPDSPIHAELEKEGTTAWQEAFHIAERSRARVFLELLDRSRQDAIISGEDGDPVPESLALADSRRVLPAGELIDAVREHLLQDGKTVFLEYVLADPHSILFVVTKSDFEVIVLDEAPKGEVERLVGELREFAQWAPNMKGNPYFTESYPHGKKLFDLLVRPALEFRDLNGNPKPLVREGDELLVAADGALNLLPFSLLLTGEPDRVPRPGDDASGRDTDGARGEHGMKGEFEERWEDLWNKDNDQGPFDFGSLPYLTRSFGLRMVASAQSAVDAVNGTEEFPAKAALFASPLGVSGQERKTIPAGEFSVELQAQLKDGLSTLPASGEEVEEIAVILGNFGLQTSSVGRAGPEEVARARGLRGLVTHFSCHGILNEAVPRLSGLVLERKEDELFPLLSADQIIGLGIRSELTVLSACDTGHGKLVEGEGAIALTRSFLAGGSRSVVASLWKVPDQATAELMKLYYTNLTSGMDRARALADAQHALSRNPLFSHPANWAAFTLTGAGGALVTGSSLSGN